jgi:hypothetical protein
MSYPRPEFVHPDPRWWLRLGPSTVHHELDICDDCGHVRFIHLGVCQSPTAGLDAPAGTPCMCGHAAGSLSGWRSPMISQDLIRR